MDETSDILDTARQDNIARILEAAERLFRHYGYAKTNVADIARDLGMSPANIYRFFASKTEIHQAICGRMLAGSYQQAFEISQLPISAADRLRRYLHAEYQLILTAMLDHEKVHEMVIVAIERDWHVIEKHIDRHAPVAGRDDPPGHRCRRICRAGRCGCCPFFRGRRR